MTGGFEEAVATLADMLGPAQLRAFADRIAAGHPRDGVLRAVPVPGFPETAARVLDAQATAELGNAEAAAYVRGVADGQQRQAEAIRVEPVWSGPGSHAVPVRATAGALVELVHAAGTELVLATYSARPYKPLVDALTDATARGVAVTVMVETLHGAGSALAGAEPAAAFTRVPGVQVWHWPVDRRGDSGTKMHAKLAVADRRELLVSSANLTQSGVTSNLEAGVLVRGGTAPARAAEHLAELRSRGVFTLLAGQRTGGP